MSFTADDLSDAPTSTDAMPRHEFVVVANRLPVDRVGTGAERRWRESPGGLVTGLAPVMKDRGGAWVGWAGAAGEELEAFDHDGMHLIPVPLSASEVRAYYEGFSNATLWPIYHDVIVPPEFHRKWWEAYVRVNTRFARAAAQAAAEGATVWVHDYQLQLVPGLLRELRPDVRIGFFNHIPFPPYEIFAQLPWRSRIVSGLLGADLIGFQRPGDTANFRRAVRRTLGYYARNSIVRVPAAEGVPEHICATGTFPISIDAAAMDRLARDPQVRARAEEIRREVGDPTTLLLGVDRMDYTKGIGHRLKAYEELLADGHLSTEDTTFIQVATPSREQVESYQQIRDDIELTVGRINGEHSGLGTVAVHYLHHSYPRAEMVAFYLAADVMLVTSLRDGMNLVAKEYAASRVDGDGVLILSEFTGAADQLRQAILVNPHDVAGLKRAISRAVHLDPEEAGKRMSRLRRNVMDDDVMQWSQSFLERLDGVGEERVQASIDVGPSAAELSNDLLERLAGVCSARRVLIALDFDGVVSPLVADPGSSAPLPESSAAVERLVELEDVYLAFVSGRQLEDLVDRVEPPDSALLAGSHGAQLDFSGLGSAQAEAQSARERTPSAGELTQLERLDAELDRISQELSAGGDFLVERKPLGRTVHTRGLDPRFAEEIERRMEDLAQRLPELRATVGHDVREFAVRHTTKGDAIRALRAATGADAILYIGDDRTDEDAFAQLRQDGPGPDLGIKVGPGDTLAVARVADPWAVSRVLEESLRMRRSAARD